MSLPLLLSPQYLSVSSHIFQPYSILPFPSFIFAFLAVLTFPLAPFLSPSAFSLSRIIHFLHLALPSFYLLSFKACLSVLTGASAALNRQQTPTSALRDKGWHYESDCTRLQTCLYYLNGLTCSLLLVLVLWGFVGFFFNSRDTHSLATSAFVQAEPEGKLR